MVIILFRKQSRVEGLLQKCGHPFVVVTENAAAPIGVPVEAGPDGAERGRHDVAVLVSAFERRARPRRKRPVTGRIDKHLRFDREHSPGSRKHRLPDSPLLLPDSRKTRIVQKMRPRFFQKLLINPFQMFRMNAASCLEIMTLSLLLQRLENPASVSFAEDPDSVRPRHEDRDPTGGAHSSAHGTALDQQHIGSLFGCHGGRGTSRRSRPDYTDSRTVTDRYLLRKMNGIHLALPFSSRILKWTTGFPDTIIRLFRAHNVHFSNTSAIMHKFP